MTHERSQRFAPYRFLCGATLMALALTAALGSGCAGGELPDVDEEATAESEDAIKNGTVWDPWTQATQTWTRNVVRLPGCTGTLMNREWVLTAGHCFPNGTETDPSTISANLRLDDGSTATSYGVELLFHPQTVDGVDVALLRLATPIDPGVASLPLYTGTTASLIGDTVFCAGYGAIDSGASCSDTMPCPSGQYCHKWGVCLTPTDGNLRTASFSIIEDPLDPVMWYRFQVPNVLGQMELPGDSGSSCWNGSGLTGVMKAGNTVNYNRQTSAEAFRDWVNGIVNPTVVKQVNQAGTYCRPVGSGSVDYGSEGEALNATAGSVQVVCPMQRPGGDDGYPNVVDVPRLFVLDRHASQNVCCKLQSKNPTGTHIETTTVCSSGASADYQPLQVPSLYDPYSWSQFSLHCTVPGSATLGLSGVQGYRSRQSMR